MPAIASAKVTAKDQSANHQSNAYEANNTGKNKRDAKVNELTAQDQSNAQGDVETTRAIRQAIVDEKSLSTSAHNVKIIVANRAVTLKGPVKSAQEKDQVIAKAKAAAPNMNIVNELEVIK